MNYAQHPDLGLSACFLHSLPHALAIHADELGYGSDQTLVVHRTGRVFLDLAHNIAVGSLEEE